MWFDRETELAEIIGEAVDSDCTVLDVGGGNGKLSKRVAEITGARVHICDVGTQRMRGLTYLPMDRPDALPCGDATFDVVLMAFMLHHLANRDLQERLLREAARVARRRIVLLEDTAEGQIERVLNAAWDLLLNVPQGIPTPLNFRSIAGWERALRVSGFVNVRSRRFRGMWPILRSYQQAVIVGDVASPAVTTSG